MLSADSLPSAQVLPSAAPYWLIEQISYFFPSCKCNYPLAKEHSRPLMAFVGDATAAVGPAQVGSSVLRQHLLVHIIIRVAATQGRGFEANVMRALLKRRRSLKVLQHVWPWPTKRRTL